MEDSEVIEHPKKVVDFKRLSTIHDDSDELDLCTEEDKKDDNNDATGDNGKRKAGPNNRIK